MPRLDHYDVTRSVDLTNPQHVCATVCDLLSAADPGIDHAIIERAFNTFSRLYAGTLPGYHGCETLYHDMQHALDVTLACARMLAGHERVQAAGEQFDAERLTLGILVALFHDAGYIRRRDDQRCWHGAQYTLQHVSRGGQLLDAFLVQQGLAGLSARALKLIHYTGYEMALEDIGLDDARDRRLGRLIGTADLIAQMADRAYLEKCRDYLYQEFELGGLTRKRHADGSMEVVYDSGFDLLSKTPAFYNKMVRKRLDADFEQGYRFLEVLFNGSNPYLAAIERNMTYLQQILGDGRLHELLRRRPEAVLAPQEK